MKERKEIAKELFLNGYNCAQAVAGAFKDLLEIDENTLMKIASPFGGGIAGQRLVCGAANGMYIVAGLLMGNPCNDREKKKELYVKIKKLSDDFKEENGSLICGELLTAKTKKKPCPLIVETAVTILIKELNIKETL